MPLPTFDKNHLARTPLLILQPKPFRPIKRTGRLSIEEQMATFASGGWSGSTSPALPADAIARMAAAVKEEANDVGFQTDVKPKIEIEVPQHEGSDSQPDVKPKVECEGGLGMEHPRELPVSVARAYRHSDNADVPFQDASCP
jgi:hypothetical protein